VQTMVASILGLAELPRPADAADALALGICHLWRPSVPSGGDRVRLPSATRAATPAQRAWALAEAAARR